MYHPDDDASHLLVAGNACTECAGACRVTVGIEPITYSGSGDDARFRDVKDWCPRCEGSGIEPKHYCGECEAASILDCCECGDTIERERAARYGWHVEDGIAMCRACEYQAARV
ncbi:MAG: hypothetical protein IT518_20110 [Burkholderiales bacterium]|nr:hypothetical protein [Burkholderiales bacterium]